jgi:amino acid permease
MKPLAFFEVSIVLVLSHPDRSWTVHGSQSQPTSLGPKGGGVGPKRRHKISSQVPVKKALQPSLGLSTGSNRVGHAKVSSQIPATTVQVSSKRHSTAAAFVFNLVNNVAGAGMLTLSAGMASGSGWIPAILICVGLGALSAHTFCIIGEACELTGEKDFKGIWSKTIGNSTTFMVDAMIAVMCIACCVIYSGILGDVFTPLLARIGFPDRLNGRTSNILAITTGVLFPLSLVKDLSALAFTSILGFAAIVYTVLFIVIRALDGSYTLGSGRFAIEGVLAGMPSFEKSSLFNFDFSSLVLASNLGLAFIAHYNAPSYYRSLTNTNSKRFRTMVNIAFLIIVSLYTVTMTAGYGTFGEACRGNILLNYHPGDILSTLGRFATGLSILFGFPLVACGARESIVGLASSFGYDSLGADKNHLLLVIGILAFVTSISCTVKDVSLIVGLTGATLGSLIVYVCPAIIYTKAVSQFHGNGGPEHDRAMKNLALIPFGLFIACLGCFMTVKEALAK